jgi:DNA-binding transcriptional LysR family regulator
MSRRIKEDRIRYLFECAHLGTMRAAAEKLDVATSSVSRQLSKLEDEVGHSLYEKRRHRFQLTEVGRILCDFYRRRTVDSEQLYSVLDQVGALKKGSVNIALGEGFIANLISPVMSNFSRRHPGIRINVTVYPTTREVIDAILEDEAHFGLVFDPPSHPHLRILKTMPQPLCAITKPSDPIAKIHTCRLSDLVERNILLNQDYMLFDIVRDAAEAEGLSLEPKIMSNSLPLLAACVKDDAGISILSELSVAQYLWDRTLAATPIDNPSLGRSHAAIIVRLGRQLPKSAEVFLRNVEVAVTRLASRMTGERDQKPD